MSKSIVQYVSQEAVKNNIQETLGEKTPQFIASVASLVNSNPAIAECDQKTILSACLIASSLDLPINQNLGFAYIIPYNKKIKTIDDNGKEIVMYQKQAQFQMGYKGFIQLAMRSNQFKTLNVTDVREGEIVKNDRLTGEMEFEFIEEDRDKANVVGYVAYMQLSNGFTKQLYMTVQDLRKHGTRFSKSFKSGYGLWKDDFDSMARKTVIKLLLSRYAPMTVDMIKAQEADQAVINDDQYKYLDNEPVDPEQEAAERETKRIIAHIKKSETQKELKLCEDALQDQDQKVGELYKAKMKELKKK